MQIFLNMSKLILPMLIVSIIAFGMWKKIPVYDSFVEGAEAGMKTVLHLIPTMIGLMLATGVLRASGFLDLIAHLLEQAAGDSPFPACLFPMAVLRLFSSSAATGLLLDVYQKYGPDSRIGVIASLMMSSTETIFYTMSVYFLSMNVKKTRYTLPGAFFATVCGIAASVVLGGWMCR